jgi:hypothetical protein
MHLQVDLESIASVELYEYVWESRRDIDGGTPFDATHKYAAIWSLLTFVIDNTSPSTTFTIRMSKSEKVKKVK